MKIIRRLFAVLFSITMIIGTGITAFAEDGPYSITINNDTAGYEYYAYQIFKGDLSGEVLSNVAWGDGITTTGQNALYGKYNLQDPNKTAAKVAEAIVADTSTTKADDIATLLAKTTSSALNSGEKKTLTYDSTNKKYSVSGLSAGWYLVVNSAVPGGDATGTTYSDYIVQVVKNVTVDPKSALTTSDKTVEDDADSGTADDLTGTSKVNATDARTTYESADHQLYETYKYTLKATLPNDTDLDSYDTYKLVFHDEMSKGISFLGNVSVTATNLKDNTTIAFTLSNNVENATASAGVTGDPLAWTLTIDDLKQYVTTLKGTVVTVTFDAYLNENAIVSSVASGTSTASNNNTYYLEYSNNPNAEGTGKTAPDTVYVFTYDMPNTKYKDSVGDNNKLANAGFTIKDSNNTALKFVPIDSSGAAVTSGVTEGTDTTAPVTPDTVVAYRLAKTNEAGAITVIGTLSDGTFNLKGLDAGTYTIIETFTPSGYNTCPDSTIVITGNTEETGSSGQATMTMTMNGNSSTNNNFINKSGSTLPTTGGIGTTVFYVIGGVLVAGAAVMLIAKNKMSKN